MDIGTTDERAVKIMSELYKPFDRDGHPLKVMDERSLRLYKAARDQQQFDYNNPLSQNKDIKSKYLRLLVSKT